MALAELAVSVDDYLPHSNRPKRGRRRVKASTLSEVRGEAFGPNYYAFADSGKSFARIRLQSQRPIEKQDMKRHARIEEWVSWAVGTAASISFGVVILSIVLIVQASSNSDPNAVFTGVVAFTLFSIILAVSLRLSKSIKQFSSVSGEKWQKRPPAQIS